MFLMKCEQDNSYCIVEDADVIYDESVVINNGDIMNFRYNKHTYEGRFMMRSDDTTKLRAELKRLTNSEKTCTTTSDSLKKHSSTSSEKRLAARKRNTFSSQSNGKATIKKIKTEKEKSDYTKNRGYVEAQVSAAITESKENMKVKQTHNQKAERNDSSDDNVSLEEIHDKASDLVKLKAIPTEKASPTKQELKDMLAKLLSNQSNTSEPQHSNEMAAEKKNNKEKCIKSIKSIKIKEEKRVLLNLEPNTSSYDKNDSLSGDSQASGEDVENDELMKDDNDQLFGRNWKDEKMVLLSNSIYCKKKIFDSAIAGSHRSSHVARRLIEGVFRPTAIEFATFSGQKPRAQGKERQAENVHCLHQSAKTAIIDFAKNLAKKKGWSNQTDEELGRAMSQRIGEIKREIKNARAQGKLLVE